MVRGRRVRTNNTNNNVYTNRGITNKVMNGSTNPTDPNSEFRSSGQTLNGTQLSDEQYCASPKRKDCKIDNNVTNLHTALQEMSSTTIITNNNNKKLSSSSSSSKIPCHPDQANYDIFVGSTKSSLQQTSSTIKTRSQQQTAIKNFFRQTKHGGGGINDEIYVNGDTIGAELEIRTTTPTSLINNNIINNLITHEEDTCDGGLFQYSIVQQNCQNLINNNNNNSSSSSSNEQYNMTNNIFLQEPVLSLNVDKSPNQPSSIKINKTLEVNPIFSTITTTTTTQQQSLSASINGCYQNHLNGQFNKIVTLNTSPKQQNYNILDDNYEIITTNDYNNDNEPSLYLLLNNDSNSCDSGVVIDKQLELSPNRRRKPTTPHRILCPSPVKHAIVEKSPTSALINNNNNNNLNLLNGGHHQLALVTTKTTTTTTDEEDEDIGGAEGRRHEEEEINNIIDVNDSEILNNVHGIIGTGLNGVVQKRYPKSRRRLNINQSENNSSITPQIIGGVTLSNQSLKRPNSNNNNNNNNQKSILNSAKNPSAEQNTNNNYKLTHSKHRTNGHHLHHHSRDNRHGSSHHHQHTQQSQTAAIQQSIGDNKKLTDFYPVRRSVRKTKKVVQEEIMRGIEKAILEGRDDGLKVENFEGKGRGVIAERSFKRGEFVVEYIGDLINTAEANQREKQYSLDENAGCYMYYFKHRNQQYCIDATAETGKLGRLVNHSRNGNLITKVVVVKNHPHLVLIAKDDIRPGEELTYDYGDRSKEALLHHPWLAL